MCILNIPAASNNRYLVWRYRKYGDLRTCLMHKVREGARQATLTEYWPVKPARVANAPSCNVTEMRQTKLDDYWKRRDIIEKYWPMLTVQIQRKIMQHVASIVSPRDLVMQALRDQPISIPRIMPYVTGQVKEEKRWSGKNIAREKLRLSKISRDDLTFYFGQCTDCSKYIEKYNTSDDMCKVCKKIFCVDCFVVSSWAFVPHNSCLSNGFNVQENLCRHCDRGAKVCAVEFCGQITNNYEYCYRHKSLGKPPAPKNREQPPAPFPFKL